jgi:CheY-like chemotaxis protein
MVKNKTIKKSVLLVDDEENIRELVKALMEEEGYNVKTAENGKKALEMLHKEKFDLILLDFFMPGMSGREVAEEIRKDVKLKDSKLAFLTVAEFGKQGNRLMKAVKCLDYIKKPFDNDDLKRRVKKMIG